MRPRDPLQVRRFTRTQQSESHASVTEPPPPSLGSDGALKRAVPLWFSLPEFRPLISSYEPAARNHGGEGALYVRLRRLPHDTGP